VAGGPVDGTVAGGITPAVLAFLGGYSVEMLFTAIDRLVHAVAGRLRAPHRNQVGDAGPAQARGSGKFGVEADPPSELPANGAASARTASPVAALTTGRGKS